MAEIQGYGLRFAYERGRHHYFERDQGDTAESSARLITSDPAEQAEAVRGWKDAERGERPPPWYCLERKGKV